MEDTVNYFAYGAIRDPLMISAITGTEVGKIKGTKAILKGYKLAIQKLSQIPDEVYANSPVQISPRKLLTDAWGEDFESYVLVEDPEGVVEGVIWELSKEERDSVRDWELLDFGWFHDSKGIALNEEGVAVEVDTESISKDQEIDRFVDGMNYETLLYPSEVLIEKATKAHKDYLDRLSETHEEIINT